MPDHVKAICVYASSSDALARPFFEAALALGTEIARRKYHLVYGGGKIGLMGAIARAVQAGDGTVTGVIPEALLEQGYDEANEMIVTPNMRERKAMMEEQADAFVGLPGGFGTLEEVLQVITLKQLRFHDKPVVLLNTEGFYERLIALFDHIIEHDFAKAEYRGLYHVADSPRAALDYIEGYQPAQLPDKWFK